MKFVTGDEREEVLTLQREEREREFKSLDGAVSVARRIGFDWVRVEIGNLQWEERLSL
ncbi:hypothetical protein [Motiliproteus sediminis]|uniref:hypothetical protein n=1 Tax=Motiliproteus sediminis TaxID=1468178 RepID=UPI001FE4BF06|nr:hypothetical protein [Motiliproteus sediminis]